MRTYCIDLPKIAKSLVFVLSFELFFSSVPIVPNVRLFLLLFFSFSRGKNYKIKTRQNTLFLDVFLARNFRKSATI